MANIREIKLRIKSVTQTQQITKAMKLISVSKLKKARLQLDRTKPYFQKVEMTLADILTHSAGYRNIYFDKREGKQNKKTGIIVLSGDKSLAGGYNHNITKLAEGLARDAKNPVLFVAGIMGRAYFKKTKYTVNELFDFPVQNPTVDRAREISDLIFQQFVDGELDEVYIAYTGMVSTIKLVPIAVRLLPLDIDVLKGSLGVDVDLTKTDRSINYEPSPDAVFDVLIPKYLKGVIYGAFVEAFTSEQSARMTAMDSATTNAEAMLQKLNLYYNRARQSAITQEISEIVGGASALK